MTEATQPVYARQRFKPIENLLSDARLLIEPTQRAAIETLPAELRHVAGFHLGGGAPTATRGQRSVVNRYGQLSHWRVPEQQVGRRNRRLQLRLRWNWCTTFRCYTTT